MLAKRKLNLSIMKETLLEWSKRVDINCYNKLIEYKGNYFVQFIWLIILLGSTSATLYLIAKNVIDFLKFDVTSQINIINEIPAKFPTITFCDNNPFSSLQAQYLMENISLNQDFYDPSNALEYAKRVASSKSLSDDERKLLGNFHLYEQFYCSFKGKYDCTSNFKWYWSFEYGNCYQFTTKENVTRSGKEHGLKIEVYLLINLNKYVTPESRGLVLFVHDQKVKPRQEVFIKYGEKTYVSVNRVYTQKYPLPYSDCIDFSSNKFDFYSYIIKLNRTYRQEDCFELCIQKEIIKKCQCYYTKYDDLDTDVRPCLNDTDINCVEEQIDNFNLDECQSTSCPLECDSVRYDLSLSSLVYPDKDYYNKVFNMDQDIQDLYSNFSIELSYDLFRSNSAFFTVYYPNLQYTYISETPKTEIIDLFTQIGGALGMFVSFSVFTIFEFIEIGVLLLKNLFFMSGNHVSGEWR